MARTAPRKFSAIEDTGDLKPCHNSTQKIWVPFMPLDPKRDAGVKAVVDAGVLITCRPLGGRIEGPTILK